MPEGTARPGDTAFTLQLLYTKMLMHPLAQTSKLGAFVQLSFHDHQELPLFTLLAAIGVCLLWITAVALGVGETDGLKVAGKVFELSSTAFAVLLDPCQVSVMITAGNKFGICHA